MKHSIGVLLLALWGATAWAQDSGETRVQVLRAYEHTTTDVATWALKRFDDGLEAVRITNARFITWERANDFCRGHNFGGHGGWRVPDRRDAERYVKVADMKSGSFWIAEPNAYYFVYPGRANAFDVITYASDPANQHSPLCVADGRAAAKAASPATPQAAKPGADSKVSKDDVAMANYERLRLERDKPGSEEARNAASKYRALLAQQAHENAGGKGKAAGGAFKPLLTREEVAMANYERLRLEREQPGSAAARQAERDYQAMLKAQQAQDKPKAEPKAKAEKKLYVYQFVQRFKTPYMRTEDQARRWLMRDLAEAWKPGVFVIARKLLSTSPVGCTELEPRRFECTAEKVWELTSEHDPNAPTSRGPSKGISR